MKTNHTPGPWHINGEYHIYAKTAQGALPVRVAQAVPLRNGNSDERGANARLIAAAPELLEALKYAAELVQTARQHFPKPIKNADRFKLENTCATINKAIAKADGKEGA